MSQGRKKSTAVPSVGGFRQARVGQGAGDLRIRRKLAALFTGDDTTGLVKLDAQGRITVDEEALLTLVGSSVTAAPGTGGSTGSATATTITALVDGVILFYDESGASHEIPIENGALLIYDELGAAHEIPVTAAA